MRNRKLTCKQMKILAWLSVFMLILINGFIIETSKGVLARTVFELGIFIWIVTYMFCKVSKKDPKDGFEGHSCERL